MKNLYAILKKRQINHVQPKGLILLIVNHSKQQLLPNPSFGHITLPTFPSHTTPAIFEWHQQFIYFTRRKRRIQLYIWIQLSAGSCRNSPIRTVLCNNASQTSIQQQTHSRYLTTSNATSFPVVMYRHFRRFRKTTCSQMYTSVSQVR